MTRSTRKREPDLIKKSLLDSAACLCLLARDPHQLHPYGSIDFLTTSSTELTHETTRADILLPYACVFNSLCRSKLFVNSQFFIYLFAKIPLFGNSHLTFRVSLTSVVQFRSDQVLVQCSTSHDLNGIEGITVGFIR